MKKLVLSILTITLSLAFCAQDMIVKQAHKKYGSLAYAEAIDLYEYAVEKDVKDVTVLRNLADSYEKIRDFEKACKYYGELVLSEQAIPSDYLKYAQNLKTLGRYEDSRAWMSKYEESIDEEYRASMHTSAGNYEENLKSNRNQIVVERVNINSPKMDWGTSVFGDKVVFASNRPNKDLTQREHNWNGENFLDLYEGEVSEEGNISDLKPLKGTINSIYHEGGACFSADGKTIWFTRNNYFEKKIKRTSKQIVNLKIFSATLNENGEWENEKPFPLNSDEYSIGHPSLSKDGKAMYFTSDMPGGAGGKDIWVSVLNEDNEWSDAINCGDINTEGDEMFPFMTGDGTLYFSSNGHVNLGGLDVFAAIGFDTSWLVENLGSPINDAWDDFYLVLRNEKDGFFSSNRPGGEGSDDIYKFTMDPPRPAFATMGTVFESETQEPLIGAKVFLVNQNDEVVQETEIDNNGRYSFKLDQNLCDFKVRVDNGPDWKKGEAMKTPCDRTKTLVVMDEIVLERTELHLVGTLKDNVNSAPLKEYDVVLLDMNGKEISRTKTDINGNVKLALESDMEYQIRLEKDGKESMAGDFQTKNMKDDKIDINSIFNSDLAVNSGWSNGNSNGNGSNASGSGSEISSNGSGSGSGSSSNASGSGSGSSSNGSGSASGNSSSSVGAGSSGSVDSETAGSTTSNNAENAAGAAGENEKVIFAIENIYFNFDKSDIRPDAKIILNRIVKTMKENPTMILEFSSHTDSRGSSAYNKMLSEKRVQSSANYLLANGIAKNRIQGEGFGETQLKNKCSDGVKCSAKEHQQNRRTEFKILKF